MAYGVLDINLKEPLRVLQSNKLERGSDCFKVDEPSWPLSVPNAISQR